MNVSKILNYSLAATSGIWAILPRIAQAEGEEGILEETTEEITRTPVNEVAEVATEKIAETATNVSGTAETTTHKIAETATNTIANKPIIEQTNDIFGVLSVDTAIYILLAIAIIALIVAGVSLYYNNVLAIRYNKKINDLKKNTITKKYIDDINEKLSKNENELEKIKNYLIKKHDKRQVEQKPINASAVTNSIEKVVPEKENIVFEAPREVEIEKRVELENLWRDFIKNYNSFAYKNLESHDGIRARKDFAKNYNIKYFYCENYEARLNNPDLEINFKDTNTSNDMYWGFNLMNEIYAVVPKLNITYGYQIHEIAGMKEAFISNFDKGSYNKIIVKKPAIFNYANGNWILQEQGEIELVK